MIVSYLRKKSHYVITKNGPVLMAGNVVGALVAEQRGNDVFVNYSLFNKSDMTKEQLMFGLNKKDRKKSALRALQTDSKLSHYIEISLAHSIVQKALPDFLNRCGACFDDALTINGIDITPYRRDPKWQKKAFKTIEVYAHSNDDLTLLDKAEKLNLNADAARILSHVCDEIKLTLKVNINTGESVIVKVDGKKVVNE